MSSHQGCINPRSNLFSCYGAYRDGGPQYMLATVQFPMVKPKLGSMGTREKMSRGSCNPYVLKGIGNRWGQTRIGPFGQGVNH